MDHQRAVGEADCARDRWIERDEERGSDVTHVGEPDRPRRPPAVVAVGDVGEVDVAANHRPVGPDGVVAVPPVAEVGQRLLQRILHSGTVRQTGDLLLERSGTGLVLRLDRSDETGPRHGMEAERGQRAGSSQVTGVDRGQLGDVAMKEVVQLLAELDEDLVTLNVHLRRQRREHQAVGVVERGHRDLRGTHRQPGSHERHLQEGAGDGRAVIGDPARQLTGGRRPAEHEVELEVRSDDARMGAFGDRERRDHRRCPVRPGCGAVEHLDEGGHEQGQVGMLVDGVDVAVRAVPELVVLARIAVRVRLGVRVDRRGGDDHQPGGPVEADFTALAGQQRGDLQARRAAPQQRLIALDAQRPAVECGGHRAQPWSGQALNPPSRWATSA